jgi:hypothetical protein
MVSISLNLNTTGVQVPCSISEREQAKVAPTVILLAFAQPAEGFCPALITQISGVAKIRKLIGGFVGGRKNKRNFLWIIFAVVFVGGCYLPPKLSLLCLQCLCSRSRRQLFVWGQARCWLCRWVCWGWASKPLCLTSKKALS